MKQPGAGRHRSGSSAAERRTVFRRSPVRIRSTTCPCPSSPTWQRRRLQVPKVPGSNPGRGTTRHGSITGGDPGKGGCDTPPPRERYTMHGSRKGYPGDRVQQRSEFRRRRGRQVLTLTQALRRRSARRRTRSASGVRGNRSELARRGRFPCGRNPVGGSVHGQEHSGLAAKCEGVKHSVAQKVTELHGKAHPQSKPNTSSIGRAIVS